MILVNPLVAMALAMSVLTYTAPQNENVTTKAKLGGRDVVTYGDAINIIPGDSRHILELRREAERAAAQAEEARRRREVQIHSRDTIPRSGTAARYDGDVQRLIREKSTERWNATEAEAVLWIVDKESSFNPRARNGSGACGLFQRLPCPWGQSLENVEEQIENGLDYIKRRYQTPIEAKAFWLAHRWY